jgi:ABC transporter substrate binding protein
MSNMQRREFITLLGGAAVTWPLAASAQQPATPVVGFLHIASLETRRNQVASFYQGLKDTGYVEGQNVAIQYRWAENQNDRLPALATDLVRHQVDVIAALSTPSVLAAKNATRPQRRRLTARRKYVRTHSAPRSPAQSSTSAPSRGMGWSGVPGLIVRACSQAA